MFVHLEKKEEEEDEKEGPEEERSQEEKGSIKVHAMVSVFQFVMKQSYICALIAMMVRERRPEAVPAALWSWIFPVPW